MRDVEVNEDYVGCHVGRRVVDQVPGGIGVEQMWLDGVDL